VLAGARSLTAIAEWAADADQATRDALGVTGMVPSETTFRRTLQALLSSRVCRTLRPRNRAIRSDTPGERRLQRSATSMVNLRTVTAVQEVICRLEQLDRVQIRNQLSVV